MKLSFPFFQSAAETRRIDELTKAPPGASKLGPRESLALELREFALTHHAEIPLFGGFTFKVQDAFVAATGHSTSDVAGAQALIRDGNDASHDARLDGGSFVCDGDSASHGGNGACLDARASLLSLACL